MQIKLGPSATALALGAVFLTNSTTYFYRCRSTYLTLGSPLGLGFNDQRAWATAGEPIGRLTLPSLASVTARACWSKSVPRIVIRDEWASPTFADGPPVHAGGSFFAAVKLCRQPSLCLRQGACSLVGAPHSFLAPALQELFQPPAQISGSPKVSVFQNVC